MSRPIHILPQIIFLALLATNLTACDKSTERNPELAAAQARNTITADPSDGEALIVLETEYYQSTRGSTTHHWESSDFSGSSNNSAMVTTPDYGELNDSTYNSPELSYSAYFDRPATWYVWVRGWGDTNSQSEGDSDSLHLGLNNQFPANTSTIQTFPAGWHWSNITRDNTRAKLTVSSSGIQTVNLWMREDGLSVDKIVLTTDPDYDPTGIGPAHNDGTQTAGEQSNDIDSNKNWKNHLSSNDSVVTPRHEAGGVVVNEKLYVLGGRGFRDVSEFDPTNNKWNSKSTSPIVLNHFQPISWNNKIWVIGAFTGGYPDETSLASIYTFDPSTDNWAIEGNIPINRQRGSTGAILHNGLIYLVGGNTNGHKAGAKPWFDSFNPATGEWKVLTDAPTARDHATVAISNNKLVVAGGRQSAWPDTFTNTVATTDIFDFETMTWSVGTDIPTERAGTMTVAVGSEVIIIGGETAGHSEARNTVEAYDVLDNSWRSLQPLNQGRHGGAAAVLSNKIHVVSGSENLGGAPESYAHETLALPNNFAPTISAVTTDKVNTNTPYFLDATVTDDGLPTGTLETLWTQLSGPGTVSLTDVYDSKSTATFPTPGLYTLRLTANDGRLSTSQEFEIIVTIKPTVTFPQPGSELNSNSQVFSWEGSEVDNWWLYIGSSVGANDIHDSKNLGPNTSTTINTIPTGSSPLYVRLYYKIAAQLWQHIDYTYIAPTSKTHMVSPTPDSSLTAVEQTFHWGGDNVGNWWLYIGTTPGGYDIHNSGNLGDSTTTTLTELPNDGRTLYATLFHQSDGSSHWQQLSYEYTAYDEPRITSPAPASTLEGTDQTFSWNVKTADYWWLYVGTTAGGREIHDSGFLGNAPNLYVVDLPDDGRTIYVRLFHRQITGNWQQKDYTYTAFNKPEITSPAPSSILEGTQQTFTWNGENVDHWWIYVGTAQGKNDIYDSGNLNTSTSILVDNLPHDGSTVFLRLYYRHNGAQWRHIDSTFTSTQ